MTVFGGVQVVAKVGSAFFVRLRCFQGEMEL